MSTSATIPVTVTPEAQARINELGFQAEVDRMIEYARTSLPDVQRIEVTLNKRYDDPSPDGVWIEAQSDRPYDPQDRTSWDLRYWVGRNFPPQVLEHVGLSYVVR